MGGTPFAAPTTGLSSSQPSSQPPSLQGLLAGRGINMPQKPMISTADVRDYGTDPVTGERRFGGSSDAGYYRKLDEMYAQNPEALELAKQYSADPSQFIGQSLGSSSLHSPYKLPLQEVLVQVYQMYQVSRDRL